MSEWYDHWRERPDRIGRTRDWKDCAHCTHKSVYRGLGVRVCVFSAQPADCGRYSYTFHPWLRADGQMWCFNSEPEQYDDLGLPLPETPPSETRAATAREGARQLRHEQNPHPKESRGE